MEKPSAALRAILDYLKSLAIILSVQICRQAHIITNTVLILSPIRRDNDQGSVGSADVRDATAASQGRSSRRLVAKTPARHPLPSSSASPARFSAVGLSCRRPAYNAPTTPLQRASAPGHSGGEAAAHIAYGRAPRGWDADIAEDRALVTGKTVRDPKQMSLHFLILDPIAASSRHSRRSITTATKG
jgi:hypothetical protein